MFRIVEVVIAKSSVVLDIKPWDDETDLAEMEKNVRTIKMDGLLWGACKYQYKSCPQPNFGSFPCCANSLAYNNIALFWLV